MAYLSGWDGKKEKFSGADQLLKAMIRYGEWAVVNLGASPRWI